MPRTPVMAPFFLLGAVCVTTYKSDLLPMFALACFSGVNLQHLREQNSSPMNSSINTMGGERSHSLKTALGVNHLPNILGQVKLQGWRTDCAFQGLVGSDHKRDIGESFAG